MDIGERIKRVRKDSNLTQEEFGTRLGMSRSMVVNLEMGRLKTVDQVKRSCKMISSEFHINEEWLLTGEGDMHAPLTREAEIAQIAADLYKNREEYPYIVDIVKLLQKMDHNQWDMLFDVARQLVGIQGKYEDNKKGAE